MDQRENFTRTSLRLPQELHEKLSEAAGRKRSLNAEILARLEASFKEDEELNALQAPLKDVLYVMLDANGLPVGWDELMTHVGQLVRNAGGEFKRVEAMMINSTIPKGQDPTDRLAMVLDRYRQKKFTMSDGKPHTGERADDTPSSD